MAETALEQRVARLEGKVESFDDRFDRLERRIDALDEKLDRRVDALDAKVDGGLRGLAAEVRGLRDRNDRNIRWMMGMNVALWSTVLVSVVLRT